MGYDWGGGLAYEFALQHPERVVAVLGHNAAYRDVERLAGLRRLLQKHMRKTESKTRSHVHVLWDKNPPLVHPAAKGALQAKTCGTSVTKIGRNDGNVIK